MPWHPSASPDLSDDLMLEGGALGSEKCDLKSAPPHRRLVLFSFSNSIMPARKSKKKSKKRASEAAKRAASAIYKPLDPNRREIRLLTLHNATDPTKSISVKLRTVRFYPGIKYIALSYVWGDSPEGVGILVNGSPSSIGANLASALECFHQHNLLCGVPDGRPLPLWVDAISINQKDQRERSDQVAFMGEIYSNATHVFSWLGPPDENGIDVALDLIHDITGKMDAEYIFDDDNICGSRDTRTDSSVHDPKLEDFDSDGDFSDNNSLGFGFDDIHCGPDGWLPRKYTDLKDDCDEPDEPTVTRFLEEIARRPDLCIRDTEDDTGNTIWNAVENLLNSPYWERVWVQQEMALARATDHCHFFFCGRSHIRMRDLDMFVKLADHVVLSGQRPSRMDETLWDELRTGLFFYMDSNLIDIRSLRRQQRKLATIVATRSQQN
ncbi:hypothetical protein E8E14_012957 [Neopestalotiopsis sp. 37M]|nr:hypothetical protein E8E14_012957 [Neopestalotiopsis sp. 37M]